MMGRESLNEWRINSGGDIEIDRIKDEVVKKINEKYNIDDDEITQDIENLNLSNKEKIFLYGKETKNGFFQWTEYNLQDDFFYDNKNSLYDMDKREWEYQKEAMGENGIKKEKEVYDSPHLGYWLRTLRDISKDIDYITLDSLTRHVFDEIENRISDRVDEVSPYSFESGPRDGERTPEGVLWDREPKTEDPSKQELYNKLESFKRKYMDWDYFKKIEKSLSEIDEIFIHGDSMEKEPNSNYMNIIFSSTSQLKKIHVDSFWDDLLSFEISSPERLTEIVDSVWEPINLKLEKVVKDFNKKKIIKI